MFNFFVSKKKIENEARAMAEQMVREAKIAEEMARRSAADSDEARRRREFEFGINSKKTLDNMKKQNGKLESFKSEYINKARDAALRGDSAACDMAKLGLKRCLSKQRFVEQNISRFEMALQDLDMNKTVNEFAEAVMEMTEHMKSVNLNADLVEAQMALQNMMRQNHNTFEQMENVMSQSIDEFESGDSVTDEEIDRLIRLEAINAESGDDAKINKQIQMMSQEVKSKIAQL